MTKESLELLISEVSEYTGVSAVNLQPKRGWRNRGIREEADAKVLMYYLCREVNKVTWHGIKDLFMKNDHTTIFNAVKRNRKFIEFFHKDFIVLYADKVRQDSSV